MDLNNWYGLPAQGVAVDNCADDNFDHSALDFIGGGNLLVYSDRRPISAASMNTFGQAPSWGSAWKAFIKQNADRWHGAYIQKTTLPYADNYLDLDPTVKDPLGLTGVPHHRRFQGQRAKGRGVSSATRWSSGTVQPVRPTIQRGPLGTMGPSTHAYGGTRMGDNPETNVVEPLGVLARGAESRRAGRVGDGHQRRAQPHADGAGACLADCRVPGEELEEHSVVRSPESKAQSLITMSPR